jgi:hypothetical protein
VTDFQTALVAATMEEAAGQPCALCGRPAASVGVWIPTKTCSQRLGAPPGKVRVVVYALCANCVAQPGAQDRVEAGLLALADRRARLLAQGWELDGDDLAYAPGRPVPGWVLLTLAAADLRLPYTFVWQSDSPVVFVRTADGEIHAVGLGPAPATLPDPPAALLEALATGGPAALPAAGWAAGGRA